MIHVSNVSITVNEIEKGYGKSAIGNAEPKSFQLQVTITSDTRDFLDQVARAIHHELSDAYDFDSREVGKVLAEQPRNVKESSNG